MERFKTLAKTDPEFLLYLEGKFSDSQMALPLRSLNVGTPREEVTFEIIPQRDLRAPSIFAIVSLLARPQTLAFSLGPMLAVFAYCYALGKNVDLPIAISSVFGVLFFHISMNLFNDYGDHIKGQDRLRPRGGSRAIQNGWIRAWKVKRAAWVLLALAAICGLPAIFFHFQPVAVVAGLALFAALEFAFQKLRLKARGLAEIMAFALTGPLLAIGFAWAVSGEVIWQTALLGCIFGSISLMYFHSANFENIMPDSQAGVSTWATRAGFDASKRFSHFTSALTLGFSLFFVFVLAKEPRLLPVVFAQILFLVPLSARIAKLSSPLSSQLSGLRSEAIKLCWITTLASVGGYLWVMAVAQSFRGS